MQQVINSNRQTGKPLTQRQSNIEMLRIISMLMIVAHHFAVHGGFEFSDITLSLNKAWIQFIQMGGKIGVDVFVLISGYFLISSDSVKTSKILKFWFQLFIYSILIFAVFVGTGMEPFGIKALIKHLFPITFSLWWFASTYFVLYLLSPFINKLLNSFDRQQYKHFLLLLFILWSVIPTFTTTAFQGNGLLWFMFLYTAAGYIRKYKPLSDMKSSKWILLSLGVAILTYVSVLVFDLLGAKIAFFADHATYFYAMEKLPVFLISITLFLGFLKLNIKQSGLINSISAATFGVYLIHDADYVRTFLWKTVFKNAQFADSMFLIPYSLMVIAAVFIVCTILELARIHILEKHYLKILNMLASHIDKIKDKILASKIMKKF